MVRWEEAARSLRGCWHYPGKRALLQAEDAQLKSLRHLGMKFTQLFPQEMDSLWCEAGCSLSSFSHLLWSGHREILHFLFKWCRVWGYGEGNGTPLQYSCLENPMDGGAWEAAVHGVAKSRIQPNDFTSHLGLHVPIINQQAFID